MAKKKAKGSKKKTKRQLKDLKPRKSPKGGLMPTRLGLMRPLGISGI